MREAVAFSFILVNYYCGHFVKICRCGDVNKQDEEQLSILNLHGIFFITMLELSYLFFFNNEVKKVHACTIISNKDSLHDYHEIYIA